VYERIANEEITLTLTLTLTLANNHGNLLNLQPSKLTCLKAVDVFVCFLFFLKKKNL
jgi:hypothetical protein